jgi:hypothetical protein
VVGVTGVEVTDCALTLASAGTKPMRRSGAARFSAGGLRTRTAADALGGGLVGGRGLGDLRLRRVLQAEVLASRV